MTDGKSSQRTLRARLSRLFDYVILGASLFAALACVVIIGDWIWSFLGEPFLVLVDAIFTNPVQSALMLVAVALAMAVFGVVGYFLDQKLGVL